MSNTIQNTEKEPTLREVLDVVKLMYSDIQDIKTDVAILKTDVAILKADVKSLDNRVSDLELGQKEIKGELRLLNEKTSHIQDVVYRDSRRLDKIYDERKEVVHSFGMQWAAASALITLSSLGIAKAFFF